MVQSTKLPIEVAIILLGLFIATTIIAIRYNKRLIKKENDKKNLNKDF